MSASRFSFLYSFRVSKRDILHRILLLVLRTYVKWANNNNVREWPRTNVPEYSNNSDSTMLTPSLPLFSPHKPFVLFRILFNNNPCRSFDISAPASSFKEQAAVSSPPYCILVRNKEQIKKKRERERTPPFWSLFLAEFLSWHLFDQSISSLAKARVPSL